MNIIKTDIEGVIIIEPKIFSDDRGYFFESFSQQRFIENVCETTFVQDNESKSTYGVLRGLHYQKPTFGKYVSVELSEDNKRQFFIPRGFAHGFVVLSQTAIFQYKCDNYYAPQSEGSLLWNDKTVNIDWQIPQTDIILSEKDKISPVFSEAWFFDYNLKLY